MSAFDDLMQEGLDAGIQEDWIDRVRKATDGSPLRAENKTLKEANTALTEQVGKFRSGALGSQLNALGFAGDPDALRVPDDLDIFDTEAVTKWAVEKRLVATPEPTAQEQQQAADHAAHDRMVNAAAGADLPANADDTKRARLLAAKSADEYDAILAEGRGW